MTDTATSTDASPHRRVALTCLREGRVSILYSRTTGDLTVVEVVGRVLSSRPGERPYAVDFRDAGWACTCRDGQQGRGCKHIYAVQLVTTGAPS